VPKIKTFFFSLPGFNETGLLFQTQLLPSFLESSVFEGEAEGEKPSNILNVAVMLSFCAKLELYFYDL
jgi:hypothetical protein